MDEDSAHRLLVSLSCSYASQRVHPYLQQCSKLACAEHNLEVLLNSIHQDAVMRQPHL